MKAATVSEIKRELKSKSELELIELCLRLSKFKKENKELLTYLLYEANNENAYISTIKEEIEIQFSEIVNPSLYYITKSVRKILRNTKKYIRYSKIKETESGGRPTPLDQPIRLKSIINNVGFETDNKNILVEILNNKKSETFLRKA